MCCAGTALAFPTMAVKTLPFYELSPLIY
jgi:hypothetical protein